MADIVIKSKDENITLEFKFNSPQQFFYKVKVKNYSDGKIFFQDQGDWQGKTSFTLGKTTQLVGKLLSIDWTIIDPAGANNNFNAEAIIYKNNIECKEHQVCQGITEASAKNYSTSGQFK